MQPPMNMSLRYSFLLCPGPYLLRRDLQNLQHSFINWGCQQSLVKPNRPPGCSVLREANPNLFIVLSQTWAWKEKVQIRIWLEQRWGRFKVGLWLGVKGKIKSCQHFLKCSLRFQCKWHLTKFPSCKWWKFSRSICSSQGFDEMLQDW